MRPATTHRASAPVARRRGRGRRAVVLVALACAAAMTWGAAVTFAARDDVDLVSRAAAKGDKASGPASSISADGRYVAFQSTADNLVAPNVAGLKVFVRDRAAALTMAAGRMNGLEGAVIVADQPAISTDGQVVAFRSAAPNVAGIDPGSVQAVYTRDLQAGTTTLVSRDDLLPLRPAAASGRPAISGDGRFVAFESDAVLDGADSGTATDVYVHDRLFADTTLVSRATGAGGAVTGGTRPAISADGRYVAYQNAGQVQLRDVVASTTTTIAPGTSPVISPNGRFIVFQSTAAGLVAQDPDTVSDVFVRDRLEGTTTLVSATGGVKGNGASRVPGISDDGRYATFDSVATNLDPADQDATADAYVHDVLVGTTMLVSRARTGAKGNGASTDAHISANGNHVAFGSAATNLHPGDTDGISDVLVRDITGGVPGPAGVSPPVIPPIVPPAPPVDLDEDRDGVPIPTDKCPKERSSGRDKDKNGCLDLKRLDPTFTLIPGRYIRLVNFGGGRSAYRVLGVRVRSLVATGLPKGAVVRLTCSRRRCPAQRLVVKRGGKVTFTRLRGRRLRTGTRLTIVATAKGVVGAGAVYAVKPNDLRKQTFCARPGKTRRGSCSTRR